MNFDELFANICEALKHEQRISYRALRRRFELSDDDLADITDELIHAKKWAVDEESRVLEWVGDADLSLELPPSPTTRELTSPPAIELEREPLSYTPPHLAEKILQSKSALEGERKQVTVLFCDLANSTPLAEQIGPENMHALLNRFFELALNEVHSYEGTINQFLGDGFMALFGAPIAHEDHARRAALSAIGLQRALKEVALGAPYDVECAFRIGLNSGLVVVGSIGDNLRMDYSAIGDTTNLAARLQTAAEPRTILVSDATARLVEGYIRLEALEPVEVKGKTDLIPVFKVLGTQPRRSPIVSRSERTLSEFVGRERELATLEELFGQVESGNGQVVGIVAEAGQGKSRLLYEFRQRLANKQVTYLEGRCLSYGSASPYHPIIDVIRQNCGITEGDRSEAIAEKIRLSLQEVGMDSDETAPYLLRLLGVQAGTEAIAMLTSEAIRTRTFETLKQMSLQGCQQRPLIFEVEDLHWVDKTSEAYLSELVESLAGASILLLTTYRPGYQPPWLGKSYATQISLHSLVPQDALTVVHSTQSTTLPEPMAQDIVERAQGNPFFLEELTRAMVEHGDFQTDLTVPDTIQGVLSARIDRLPEVHKRLLQTAAVLGRAFSLRLLERIWEGSDSPSQLLDDLKRQEFLFERTGTEQPTYVFRHALTENVAYGTLLTTRRQALHAAAGQALETLYESRLEDTYDRLAYHYARTDNAAKAVEYLTRVAEKAAGGYAHAEAIATLQEALIHSERLPGAERDRSALDASIRQADSLFFLGRYQEMVELLLGQQERRERLQEPSLSGLYYLGLGHAYTFLGARQQAIESLQLALEEGTRCQDAVVLGRAHTALTLEYGFAGRLQQGIYHGEQAVALLEQTADHAWLGRSSHYLGCMYNLAGECLRSLEVGTRLHTFGERIADRRLQVLALDVIGWSHTMQGEWDAGIEALQHAIAVSPDAFETAFTLGLLGYAYLEQGDIAQAVPSLEQAVEQANQYRSRQVQSWFKTYLSETYLADGQIDRAHDLAHQGLKLAQDADHPWGTAIAQRALGRIAYTSGNLADAESHLQEALKTFSSIQAQYHLASTHLDLAALAHTQANQNAATTHLSTAYAWFKKLQVPKWAERTEQLAREYGVTLTEVELEEELSEGSP